MLFFLHFCFPGFVHLKHFTLRNHFYVFVQFYVMTFYIESFINTFSHVECNNVYMSNSTSDAVCEQSHIESLKCEKKRIDTELQLSEEQQQILIEEKQLKEREEFIRQQEVYIYLFYLKVFF